MTTETTSKFYEQLYEDVVKKLAKDAPYCYSSDYYAHKDAGKYVAEHYLPVEQRADFMKVVEKRIVGLSNYAGD